MFFQFTLFYFSIRQQQQQQQQLLAGIRRQLNDLNVSYWSCAELLEQRGQHDGWLAVMVLLEEGKTVRNRQLECSWLMVCLMVFGIQQLDFFFFSNDWMWMCIDVVIWSCAFSYISYLTTNSRGAKSLSISYYSLPHGFSCPSARFMLRVCVAIAKISSCTFHSNAILFFHVLSQVLLQSKVERTRKGRLTIRGGLFINSKVEKIKTNNNNRV